MRKDFDSRAWSANHGDDYKKLIANARKQSRENREHVVGFRDPHLSLMDDETGEECETDNAQGKGKSASGTSVSGRDTRDETSDISNDGLSDRRSGGNPRLETERQPIVVEDAIA
jgi:hypothetical protein